MIRIISNPVVKGCKKILKDGVEIGNVFFDTKNHAYSHHGKFVVFSNKNGCERFHYLSNAVKFCEL